MPEMRERRLVMDGAVCENAHSFQDPNVRTAADARAKGRQRCPVFNECMYGKMLDRRRIRCAAIFGQHVARYTMQDGTDVETEIRTFREEAFSSKSSIADFGFIDPYKDPNVVITDPDETTVTVEGWAKMVLYGPEPSSN